MTALNDRSKQIDSGELPTAGNPQRRMAILVSVLVVALIGLSAWVVLGRTTEPETLVTEEIQSVIDDYLGSWNSYDSEAFLESVTADYSLEMVGSAAALTERTEGALEILATLEPFDWEETVIGEPIMAGDGPWYVSVVEHFTSTGYPPEGVDGISTFTVVDDGGTLRIARHAYVGNN